MADRKAPPKPPVKFNGAYLCSHNLIILKVPEVVSILELHVQSRCSLNNKKLLY